MGVAEVCGSLSGAGAEGRGRAFRIQIAYSEGRKKTIGLVLIRGGAVGLNICTELH